MRDTLLRWLFAVLPLLAACSGATDELALRQCRVWADNVSGTLQESPEGLLETVEMRGHCTMAEDHLISSCAQLLAVDEDAERRLGAYTADYEQACRTGRHEGMRDPGAPLEVRYQAWTRALTGVSEAFESILGETG